MLMNQLQVWAMRLPFREWMNDRAAKRHFSEYFHGLKDKTVLEIGCGSGKGTKVIKKYFAPAEIIAIDLDPRLIESAKNNVKDPAIVFEQRNATKLGYQDNSFDAIFDFDTIHHIPGPQWQDCLKEAYRVLKSGGIFFIRDVSIEYFATSFNRILKVFFSHPYDSMYKKEEFVEYLEKLGFKILKKDLSRHFAVVAEKP